MILRENRELIYISLVAGVSRSCIQTKSGEMYETAYFFNQAQVQRTVAQILPSIEEIEHELRNEIINE